MNSNMSKQFDLVDAISFNQLYKLGIDPESLLNGIHEIERLPKDFSPERVVPDFAFNILNQFGLLYRPVLDEAFLLDGGAKPIWPDSKPFAACLSHDVDDISLYSFNQSFRGRKNAFRNAENVGAKIRNVFGLGLDCIKIIGQYGKQDPLHCYERWLQIEKEVGASSTFFFWPGLSNVRKRHISDCTYELTDQVVFDGQKCSTTEMIREMHRRGAEIGLHPSWYSFDNVDEMKRQKHALEKALDQDVVSVRQHQLHFDIRKTPEIQAKAGLQFGSTIGFNDNLGFRCGTSYPWQLKSFQTGEELSIIEIPLIIQDGALLSTRKGMRLDEDMAFEYVKQIIESVERVGGIVTLLWHPNVVMNHSWWNLYIRSIKFLKEKNAWFGTTQQVGNYYKSMI